LRRPSCSLSAHTLVVSDKTRWLIVRVVLADGTAGYGEATDFAHHRLVLAALDELRPIVASGESRAALAKLADRGAAMRVACSAVEQAMMDAAARSAGLAMAEMLGGARRSRIPVYANINRGSVNRNPAAMGRMAVKATELGYRAVKIAPFDEMRPGADTGAIEQGIARLFAVREAVGPDVAVRVDCHHRFVPETAIQLLDAVGGAGIDWIEDVLDPSRFAAADRRAFRAAAGRKGIRVAGGEHLTDLRAAASLLKDEGLDVLLPDLRLTGVRDGLSILEMATGFGVDASLHSPVSPVLDAVSIQVAAAASEFSTLERQVNETPLYMQFCSVPAVGSDGCLTLPPNTEGIGIAPELDLLNREPEPAK
jgi:galactonate dehydratase